MAMPPRCPSTGAVVVDPFPVGEWELRDFSHADCDLVRYWFPSGVHALRAVAGWSTRVAVWALALARTLDRTADDNAHQDFDLREVAECVQLTTTYRRALTALVAMLPPWERSHDQMVALWGWVVAQAEKEPTWRKHDRRTAAR